MLFIGQRLIVVVNAEQIENETGIKFGGDEERRMLQGMDKDEIIDMLLNAKVCQAPASVAYVS